MTQQFNFIALSTNERLKTFVKKRKILIEITRKKYMTNYSIGNFSLSLSHERVETFWEMKFDRAEKFKNTKKVHRKKINVDFIFNFISAFYIFTAAEHRKCSARIEVKSQNIYKILAVFNLENNQIIQLIFLIHKPLLLHFIGEIVLQSICTLIVFGLGRVVSAAVWEDPNHVSLEEMFCHVIPENAN